MTEEIEGQDLLSPKEAANFLDIKLDRLRYLRNQGRVKGIRIGYNETVYRLADLRKADIKERPKGRKRNDQKRA